MKYSPQVIVKLSLALILFGVSTIIIISDNIPKDPTEGKYLQPYLIKGFIGWCILCLISIISIIYLYMNMIKTNCFSIIIIILTIIMPTFTYLLSGLISPLQSRDQHSRGYIPGSGYIVGNIVCLFIIITCYVFLFKKNKKN